MIQAQAQVSPIRINISELKADINPFLMPLNEMFRKVNCHIKLRAVFLPGFKIEVQYIND